MNLHNNKIMDGLLFLQCICSINLIHFRGIQTWTIKVSRYFKTFFCSLPSQTSAVRRVSNEVTPFASHRKVSVLAASWVGARNLADGSHETEN